MASSVSASAEYMILTTGDNRHRKYTHTVSEEGTTLLQRKQALVAVDSRTSRQLRSAVSRQQPRPPTREWPRPPTPRPQLPSTPSQHHCHTTATTVQALHL